MEMGKSEAGQEQVRFVCAAPGFVFSRNSILSHYTVKLGCGYSVTSALYQKVFQTRIPGGLGSDSVIPDGWCGVGTIRESGGPIGDGLINLLSPIVLIYPGKLCLNDSGVTVIQHLFFMSNY